MILSGAAAAESATTPYQVSVVAELEQPWALAFLPNGSVLVTEKQGNLKLIDLEGSSIDIGGVPDVAYGGQGGLGDVAIDPDFGKNRLVYLSYAEKGPGGRGAVVARGAIAAGGATTAGRDTSFPSITGAAAAHRGPAPPR